MELNAIREDYNQRSLTKTDCADNPLTQFQQWLDDAISANAREPTAMHLATAENGKPSGRMVLLKELNEKGLVFFSNYHSRKGRQISENPQVALTFFWAELERQVRIEGTIQPLSNEESDRYFHSRPYPSRIGAWASEQSQIIASKQILLARAAKFAVQYPLNVPRPPHWGGYLVTPHYFEFWQGRPSRLHDRICYQKMANHWQKQRLAP